MPYNIISYFRLLYFHVSNCAYFLHSTSVLSFYIDVILTLSIQIPTKVERHMPWLMRHMSPACNLQFTRIVIWHSVLPLCLNTLPTLESTGNDNSIPKWTSARSIRNVMFDFSKILGYLWIVSYLNVKHANWAKKCILQANTSINSDQIRISM